jgi:hypothetical protein
MKNLMHYSAWKQISDLDTTPFKAVKKLGYNPDTKMVEIEYTPATAPANTTLPDGLIWLDLSYTKESLRARFGLRYYALDIKTGNMWFVKVLPDNTIEEKRI